MHITRKHAYTSNFTWNESCDPLIQICEISNPHWLQQNDQLDIVRDIITCYIIKLTISRDINLGHNKPRVGHFHEGNQHTNAYEQWITLRGVTITHAHQGTSWYIRSNPERFLDIQSQTLLAVTSQSSSQVCSQWGSMWWDSFMCLFTEHL